MNLQILNCVWESMKGVTWFSWNSAFSWNSEFSLDYIGVDDCALKCVDSAYIPERGEVVEGDHTAVGVNVEMEGEDKGEMQKKEEIQA